MMLKLDTESVEKYFSGGEAHSASASQHSEIPSQNVPNFNAASIFDDASPNISKCV